MKNRTTATDAATRRLRRAAAASAGLWLAMTSVTSGTAGELPHLRRQGQATQLVVDGRPFLMLGGELGNSSASSLDYLAPHWQTLEGLHLNTLLAPVYWELIEPREGVFDFSLLDGLLAEARRRRIRLVLLWFGSWKNSMSCYAPAWVKTDQERFPRARGSDGMALEILSPLGDASRDADARALAALPGRWLNGDQTHQGRHIRIPAGRVGTQRFELYRYR